MDTVGTVSIEELERIMEWYDSIAPSYETMYKDEQLVKYAELLKQFKGGETLVAIDLGCGPGFLLRYLRERGLPFAQYVGVDLSFNLLLAARKLVEELDVVADFIAGDATRVPLRRVEGRCALFLITVIRCDYKVDEICREVLSSVCSKPAFFALTILCNSPKNLKCPKGFKNIKVLGEREALCVHGVTAGGGQG